MYTITELYDLNRSIAGEYLKRFTYPWEALDGIKDLILSLGPQLGEDYEEREEHVWVHRTARIAPTAFLGAPCIIGPNAEVRHCAFIRESAIVGEDCVIGNSVELKNVILFDCVQVPHFNYVGDSILGHYSHMGAGSVTSNFRADHGEITVRCGEEKMETGMNKIGAMIGDHAEIGCNAVCNPGTIVGRNSVIYPTSCVRGTVPENSIWKNDGRVADRC